MMSGNFWVKWLCVAFCLTCVCVSPLSAESHCKDWTLMIYAVSSYDIEECVREVLMKISDKPCPDNVNVVMLYDPGSNFESAYYILKNDGFTEIEKLGETNMGSPKVLFDFLKFAMNNYPAKNYALSIFAHGTGWISSYGPGSPQQPVDYSGIELRDGRLSQNRNSRSSRAIAYDNEKGKKDCLSLPELRKALFEACKTFNKGKKIRIFIAHACLFGMFETVYELKDMVEYVLCSESFMMTGDVNYRLLLETIAAGNDSAATGRILVEEFKQHKNGKTMAFVALDEIQACKNILSEFAQILKKAGRTVHDFDGISHYVEKKYPYVDTGDLMESVLKGNVSFKLEPEFDSIKLLAEKFKRAYNKLILAFFAHHGHFGRTHNYSGLSIFWPDAKDYSYYEKAYGKLLFSNDSQWDEFLNPQ